MEYLRDIERFVNQKLLSKSDFKKLQALNNEYVLKIIFEFTQLCKPNRLTVISDSSEDIKKVQRMAIEVNEESELKLKGHTVHFDGYYDQARDKENTQLLIGEGEYASPWINTLERSKGLNEIFEIMDGCMRGKECLIRFFCLGPKNSKFTICALQLTDSFYVAHSEDLLYRTGYQEFINLNGSNDFFYFIHSAGKLQDQPPVSENVKDRRIYIDLRENRVLSVNNQYAGNSLGLKKLALRLAIHKANNENWLTEHYFIMGIRPREKKRVTYFAGAYPSACGKTSTAMLPDQQIIGDDIAYLRTFEDGYIHAANIERGIFGIIKDVNPEDDPVIYNALTTPRETIFSNVLVNNGTPYWLGMGRELPSEGYNYSGKWVKGKKDEHGNLISPAHPNARYTIRLNELSNVDPRLNDPEGVPLYGIFYGGRDSDTMPPILESLNWEHGVFLGATIESETTSATLGTVGIRKANPMANLDFLVIPLGKYLSNHQKMGERTKFCPTVFATNYFLKDEEGKYLNDILDKKIWVIWAEGRTRGDYEAIKTPIGLLPLYEDLKILFKNELMKEYTYEEYLKQFSLRLDNLNAKLDRMEKMYETEKDIPEFFWNILKNQRFGLESLKERFNKNIITPSKLLKIGI